MSDSTFAELGASTQTVAALKARGIEAPFEIQTRVVADAIAGRDILARSRTGSGKTLAFAIPIVETIQAGAKRPSGVT